MLEFLFYGKLILAATCGQAIALIVKSNAMKAKANLSKIPYDGFWKFLKDDRASIWGTFFTIVLLLLFVGEGTKSNALIVKDHSFTWWIFEFSVKAILNMVFIALMATIGYTGMDIALKLFSFTNKKINTAISQAPAVDETT
jgi:hypothetical protein